MMTFRRDPIKSIHFNTITSPFGITVANNPLAVLLILLLLFWSGRGRRWKKKSGRAIDI